MGRGKQELEQPRGTRPDAITDDAFYLIKRVPSLEATYQVRLLTYFAVKENKKLVIVVPSGFCAAPSLRALIDETGGTIRVQPEAPSA